MHMTYQERLLRYQAIIIELTGESPQALIEEALFLEGKDITKFGYYGNNNPYLNDYKDVCRDKLKASALSYENHLENNLKEK